MDEDTEHHEGARAGPVVGEGYPGAQQEKCEQGPVSRYPTPSFATAPSTTVPLKKSGLSAVCRRAAFS